MSQHGTTQSQGSLGGSPTVVTVTPPVRATARVVPSGSPSTVSNTVAARPPTGYYVIIGLGAAGTVNLVTLLQSRTGKERLCHPDNPDQVLEIRLVGHDDPWSTYHAHGMGQPPHLLCLPGFMRRPRPGAGMIRSGMRSTEFAEITDKTLKHAATMGGAEIVRQWVACIQTRSAGGGAVAVKPALIDNLEKEGLEVTPLKALLGSDYPKEYPLFRLVLVDKGGKCSLLYAHKIDICTGVGRPQNESALPNTSEARSQLWRPDYEWKHSVTWRAMITGPEALCSYTHWDKIDRVAVWGAGGIGLNMIERAEDVGCFIDWYPNARKGALTGLHRTFNLLRNDTVLKTAKTPATSTTKGDPGRAMKPGESGVREREGAAIVTNKHTDLVLYPAKQRWRFADGTLLKSVVRHTKPDGVTVGLGGALGPPTTAANDSAFIVDYDEARTELTGTYFPRSGWYDGAHGAYARDWGDGWFDRIIFCVGFDNKVTTPGVASSFIETTFAKLMYQGRQVGIESADKRIRILGAARVSYPADTPDKLEDEWNKNGTATKAYFDDLPYSAVPPGFIYSGVCIAEANGWFDDTHPNTNINTMARADLKKHFESKGVAGAKADELATEVVEQRRFNNGLITREWADSYARTGDTTNGVVFSDARVSASIPTAMAALAGLAFDYGEPLPWKPWEK